MRPDFRVLVLLLAGSCAVHAQLGPTDPDWKEAEAPPAPPVRTTGLIPLDIPRTALHFGVDPASVTLDQDGVVRYVVVATSDSGAVNAMYEGIRCATGDFKVYARHNPGSGWTVARDTPWRPLSEPSVSRHTILIARTGVCIGQGPNRSASQIVRDLKAPVDRRFWNQ
ncbi:MAG: CNP1-like family protein [Ramlibacter sp.]